MVEAPSPARHSGPHSATEWMTGAVAGAHADTPARSILRARPQPRLQRRVIRRHAQHAPPRRALLPNDPISRRGPFTRHGVELRFVALHASALEKQTILAAAADADAPTLHHARPSKHPEGKELRTASGQISLAFAAT